MTLKNTLPFKFVMIVITLVFISACGPARTAQPATPTQTGAAPQTSMPTAAAPTVALTLPPETQATGTAAPTLPPETQPTNTISPQIPSELRVAYVKDGNIWLWTETGGSLALTTSGGAISVRLSDDGQVAAFLRQVDEFHTEIWAVNTDGSGERRLVAAEELDAKYAGLRDPNSRAVVPHNFAWMPGSHNLAYNTRQVFEGPGLATFDDLNLITLAGESVQVSTLLPPRQGGAFFYSPDGRQIAVVTPESISLVDANGGNRRDALLRFERVITYSEYWFYPTPVWSADSQSLSVAIPAPDPMAAQVPPTTLWLIPTDGTPAVQTGSVPASDFLGMQVSISPDLTHVAYMRQTANQQTSERELHLAGLDGQNDVLYHVAPNLSFGGWGADPRYFVFFKGDPQEAFLGQVDSGFRPLLANAQNIFDARWVDPGRFLFARGMGGSFELALGSLDGSTTPIDTLTGFSADYSFAR